VAGRLRNPGAGRLVRLQLRRDGRWRTVARDRTSAAGRFSLRRRLRRPMSAPARIRFGGDRANAANGRRLGRINAFRRALASWYGPGLYGGRLACGGRLTPGTLGVANKTLPCGARLTLRYRGHVVRTRVVDRGPYAGAREFDLTAATRRRLHFGSTGVIDVTR
jgi:rare lipoprotein A (peptidoglycan hydrolase)